MARDGRLLSRAMTDHLLSKEPTRTGSLKKDFLSLAEVNRMIAACSDKSTTGLRNRALLQAMFWLGLRVSEACALKVKDVEPRLIDLPDRGPTEHLRYNVRHGKGDRQRAPQTKSADCQKAHALWIAARARAGISSRYLFCTLTGRQLTRDYVRGMVKRVAAKAGIEKRAHPHALRRAGAQYRLSRGVPIDVVQQWLGHASLATTLAYVGEEYTADQLARRMAQFDVE